MGGKIPVFPKKSLSSPPLGRQAMLNSQTCYLPTRRCCDIRPWAPGGFVVFLLGSSWILCVFIIVVTTTTTTGIINIYFQSQRCPFPFWEPELKCTNVRPLPYFLTCWHQEWHTWLTDFPHVFLLGWHLPTQSEQSLWSERVLMDCLEGMSLHENTGMTVYINILTLFSYPPPSFKFSFLFFLWA